MAKSETLTALDIGSSKVVCVVAELSDDGRVEVIAHGETPCRGLSNGMIVDMSETIAAVESVVRQAESSDCSIGSVVVGVSSENLLFDMVYGATAIGNESVSSGDIERVKKVCTENVALPSYCEVVFMANRSFSVDGLTGVADPIGITGVRLELESLVCATSHTYMQNIQNVVRGVGLEVRKDGFLPASMASALAVLSDDERDIGTLLLDIGFGTVDLAIYSANEVGYASVLGSGGGAIANDVAIEFNISKSEAERLILEFGVVAPEYLDPADREQMLVAISASGSGEVSLSRARLAEVIEARIHKIVAWVKEQIGYAREQYQLNVAGIVLTGGVALMPGIHEKFHMELQKATRVAVPCSFQSVPKSMLTPAYATVIGLLDLGIDMGKKSLEGEKSGSPHQGKWWRRCLDWFSQMSW